MPGAERTDASAPVDPWGEVRGPIARAVSAELDHLGVPVEPGWVEAQLGAPARAPADAAIALQRPALAVGKPPTELAAELARRLPDVPGVARVTAQGAYLNFELDASRLAATTLRAVFGRGPEYGHLSPTPEAVCVEHTSANTTGPFHIGRVRNAVIGDTLVRVLRAAGSPVTSQYYVDDVGRQAAVITWFWSKSPTERPAEVLAALPDGWETRAPGEKEDHYLGRPYPAVSAYLKAHPEEGAGVLALSGELERGQEPAQHHAYAERILGGMLASLARLGIRFDEFVWESSLIRDGSVDAVRARLAGAPHAVREENGAEAIDASGYGLPKESARIIVARADGTSLYVTRDVAFHLQKFGRFPRSIDVLGADHLLHARTLEALLAEIGEPRRPEFVLYAFFTVPGGGKMSTRAGSGVFVDTLLDEAVERAREEVRKRREDLDPAEVDAIAEQVAAGAIRYSIVRVAPEKTIAFRWEDALSFEGRSGPFLQYAYARATTLLRKAERASGPYPYRIEELASVPEVALLKSLSRLPGVVAYAARTGHVHTLANYAHDLAEEFNRFYNEVPVLRAEAGKESRIALVAAARQTLGNTLELLGLAALERM